MKHRNQMESAVKRRLFILGAVALAGCATYHPQPISPAQTAAAFDARSLTNENLRAFLETNHINGPWPRRSWDLDALTLVAFFYQPALAEAHELTDANGRLLNLAHRDLTPSNILFTANEALRGSMAEKRASARLLYGATVAFRVAGRESDEHGYAYNISADGLYVRTLAPLMPGDDAWIELRPPRTDRRVRLEAKVVWQRLFGPVHGATVPPGFDVLTTEPGLPELGTFAINLHLPRAQTSPITQGLARHIRDSFVGQGRLKAA